MKTNVLTPAKCSDSFSEPRRTDWELECREAEARAERLADNIRRAKRYLRTAREPRGDKWTKGEVSRILRSVEIAIEELER